MYSSSSRDTPLQATSNYSKIVHKRLVVVSGYSADIQVLSFYREYLVHRPDSNEFLQGGTSCLLKTVVVLLRELFYKVDLRCSYIPATSSALLTVPSLALKSSSRLAQAPFPIMINVRWQQGTRDSVLECFQKGSI